MPQVTINIGVTSGTSSTWRKQYNSLFVVLNEAHEVTTWQLAEKEMFDTVKELLENLKERLDNQGNKINYFVIDNCCKWRNKIQNIFGNDVFVQVDLFHTVKRITSTINKRHPFFNECVKELKLIFRDSEDIGDKRQKTTPDKKILLLNLDRFQDKWSHIAMMEWSNVDHILFRDDLSTR